MRRRNPPPLLPILRTEAQARILTTLMMTPDREWQVGELADHLGIPAMTVSREARLAEEAGVIRSRKVSTAKLLSANSNSPYFESLSTLLLVAFGPLPLLSEELRGLDGIEEAYIFGSWADRYRGHRGRAPADVDLLIVGEVDRSSVYAVVERVERKLGREVQVTFRTAEQWKDESDPFISTVRGRSLVPLFEPANSEVST